MAITISFLYLIICIFLSQQQIQAKSFIKRDLKESAENAFWKLQNSGGTDEENLRKSVGDHLEISYDLENGPVTFIFDKHSRFNGTLTIIAENVEITSDDLTKIHVELENLLQLQAHYRAILRNKRIGFAIKTLEYLGAAQDGYVIQSRTIPFKVNKHGQVKDSGNRRLEEEEQIGSFNHHLRQFQEERFLQDETLVPSSSPSSAPTWPNATHNCSDSFLSTWAEIPYENASCPTYTTQQAKDNGVVCLCPYDGQVPKEAIYEVDNPLFNNTPTNISWVVKYGSAVPDCLGRCGFTCSAVNQQAFQDCLNHDVCLTHVGGSKFFDNPQCGQEWGWAADDFVASLSFECCDEESDSDSGEE